MFMKKTTCQTKKVFQIEESKMSAIKGLVSAAVPLLLNFIASSDSWDI